jgi:hypothetical protein
VTAAERLVGLGDAKDRYDFSPADLLPEQLAAADERLQSRIASIPLLANRAQSAGITRITETADLVPLLFAHSTYKSYSDRWLGEGRWDRMCKWLETVSTLPVEGLDLDGVRTLDDWVKRLASLGHYLSCSSGTTGKPALISNTARDIDLSGHMQVASCSWATGLPPGGERKFLGLGPHFDAPKNEAIRRAMVEAFSARHEPYQFPVAPITIGSIVEMVTLRRKVADGTARPAEIQELQGIASRRLAEMAAAVADAAEAIIRSRAIPILAGAMFNTLYTIAEAVRARGYSGREFHPDNALMVAGGLKGAVLPPNYREYILETLNVAEERVYHLYSMQEITTPFPMCGAGRYHVAPWVLLLPLDEGGERLLAPGNEEIEARAAFFDISLEGRWGGVITGDRIRADFRACACGHQGPTVGREITRYSDLPGGDKITCAGSIDAYVRGVA